MPIGASSREMQIGDVLATRQLVAAAVIAPNRNPRHPLQAFAQSHRPERISAQNASTEPVCTTAGPSTQRIFLPSSLTERIVWAIR